MDTDNDRKTFVNTLMDNELLEKLDKMVGRHESTRAQFIRLLIRNAWEEEQRVVELKNRVLNGGKK